MSYVRNVSNYRKKDVRIKKTLYERAARYTAGSYVILDRLDRQRQNVFLTFTGCPASMGGSNLQRNPPPHRSPICPSIMQRREKGLAAEELHYFTAPGLYVDLYAEADASCVGVSSNPHALAIARSSAAAVTLYAILALHFSCRWRQIFCRRFRGQKFVGQFLTPSFPLAAGPLRHRVWRIGMYALLR